MKLLWVYDHPFFSDQDDVVYSRSNFPALIWDRYLEHFDSIIVVGRNRPLQSSESKEKLVLSSRAEVTFFLQPSLANAYSLFSKIGTIKSDLSSLVDKVDGVIARVPSIFGSLTATIASKMDKAYMIEVVGCPFDSLWNFGSLSAKAISIPSYLNLRKICSRAPHALYVSQCFLQSRYPCKGISLGVSDVEIPDLLTKARDFSRMTKKKNSLRFRIGFLGFLGSKVKGLDICLKAFSKVIEGGIDAELHILGRGPQQNWMDLSKRLGIREKIIFHGLLPSGDPVFKWMDDIDLFVAPSRQEGLPRAIVEAMSRGCPVLGSMTGGIPELLPPECLHKTGDVGMLAKQIIELFARPDKLASYSKRNIEFASSFNKIELHRKRSNFIMNWKLQSGLCEN